MARSYQIDAFRRLFNCVWLHAIFACSFMLAATAENPALGEDAANDSQCVLLKNDNVIYGAAHQVGEYVVIRKGDQGELRLPRASVACWAGSPRDLYRYRLDHRETDGFDAHIKDAEWCLQNDLLDLARVELQEARVIMPGSHQLARLEDRIDRMASPATRRVPVVEIDVASVEEAAEAEDSLANTGLNPQSVAAFARHVQVTLVNRCGNCHAADTNRAWTIARSPGNSRASAQMTSENLLATLPFIDLNEPLNSPLLTKAVNAHGGGAAPLGPRHARAVYSIKRWLLQMGYSAKQSARPSDRQDYSRSDSSANPVVDEPQLAAKRTEPAATDASNANLFAPNRMPAVENPFDPELFNRQFHLP